MFGCVVDSLLKLLSFLLLYPSLPPSLPPFLSPSLSPLPLSPLPLSLSLSLPLPLPPPSLSPSLPPPSFIQLHSMLSDDGYHVMEQFSIFVEQLLPLHCSFEPRLPLENAYQRKMEEILANENCFKIKFVRCIFLFLCQN